MDEHARAARAHLHPAGGRPDRGLAPRDRRAQAPRGAIGAGRAPGRRGPPDRVHRLRPGRARAHLERRPHRRAQLGGRHHLAGPGPQRRRAALRPGLHQRPAGHGAERPRRSPHPGQPGLLRPGGPTRGRAHRSTGHRPHPPRRRRGPDPGPPSGGAGPGRAGLARGAAGAWRRRAVVAPPAHLGRAGQRRQPALHGLARRGHHRAPPPGARAAGQRAALPHGGRELAGHHRPLRSRAPPRVPEPGLRAAHRHADR